MNNKIHELFTIEPTFPESAIEEWDTEDKILRCVHSIKKQILLGKNLNIAISFGKDSSILANMALTALKEVILENGSAPLMMFTHSNTLLENPLVVAHANSEIRKLKNYAKKHKLPVRVDVVSPNLSNNYLVSIIGGRTTAILSSNDSKCSDMMKVAPINRHKNKVFKEFGKENTITLIGKRLDESVLRKSGMLSSGENDQNPISNKNGEYILSPICHFNLDDVFYYIGMVRSDLIHCYSDFSSLVELYRDSNAGDCMVNAVTEQKGPPCKARNGCHICLRATDSSMMNMLKEEKYSFMQPLHDFRNYIKNQHFNAKKRNWLARTINKDGSINITPAAYSPEHCKELLKIALTIDFNEIKTCKELGIEPRFTLLRRSDVLAIDIIWSRYGYQKGLEASKIYRDIYFYGQQYTIPEHREYLNKELPRTKLSVFINDKERESLFSGLRDIEAYTAGCENTITKKSGRYSSNQLDEEFSINPESAELFFEFEMDYAIEQYNNERVPATSAFHYLSRLGVVNLYKGSHSNYDRMLNLANTIERLDLRNYLNNPGVLFEKLSQKVA